MSGGTPRSVCSHTVHFYDQAYPAQAASDFIAAGLLAGDACVVMLVGPHRQAVERALNTRGIATDPDGAHPGTYVAIDTDEALSQLVVDGRLDMKRAAESLAALLRARAQGGTGQVRLIGDPAPALFAAGNQEDAIALEGLVDQLANEHGAAVFCAYPTGVFCREGHTRSLFRVSAEHSALAFPEQLWVRGFLPQASATWPAWPAAAGRTRP